MSVHLFKKIKIKVILIGSTPLAPETNKLIDTVKSASYHSFEVSIYCASDSLPFDSKFAKSILHVSSGTNVAEIGSRVFAFWRRSHTNEIFIGNPIGTDESPILLHTCVANTFSTYKMVISPDQNDSSKSIVELYIDGISSFSKTADKVRQ